MNTLKQLLVVAVGCALAGVMVLLGAWQLRAYHASGNQSAAVIAAQPPLELPEVAPAGQPVRGGFGRSVRAQGHYQPGLQVLVPATEPGSYRVLSGLKQDDGSIVVVVRGVVTTRSVGPPPTGPVTQVGVLLPSEDNAPSAPTPPDQLDAVRLPLLAQRWSGQLVGGYVTLSAPDAASQGITPAPLNLPEARGRLRNAAYAYQWWLFAAFTVAMALRIARDLRRQAAQGADGFDDVVHSNAT